MSRKSFDKLTDEAGEDLYGPYDSVSDLIEALNAYYCSKRKRFELIPDAADGWDLPAKRCNCGGGLRVDGHRLPYAMLHENDLNGYEYVFPRRFRAQARELLMETFQGSINVYRVNLRNR